MTAHYVVGDSMSPFMKRVMIPFWVVRILFMVIDIIAYGLAIGVIAAYADFDDDEFDDIQGSFKAALAIAVVIVLLILVCLALDIVCIVKRARRTLSPRFFLITNVIQTLFWTIMFILTMIGTRSGVTIAVGVLMFLSFLGLLIYASVIYHRHRKGTLQGFYAPANSQPQFQGFVQPGGYANYPQPSYPQAGYGVPADYQQAAYQQPGYQQTAYQPTDYQSAGANAAYGEPQQQKPVYYDPHSVQAPHAGAYEMDNRTSHA